MNATAEAPAASKTPSRHVAESMDGVRLQDGLPRLIPARLVEFIERELPYRFAVTMPGVPHEYAHRDRARTRSAAGAGCSRSGTPTPCVTSGTTTATRT